MTTTLEADGPNATDTYELIRSVFGSNSIEAPDLYDNNHNSDGRHIWEESDDEVGHHFVFSIHRDLDWDRDKYPGIADRQRNEIKTYSSSDSDVKGYYGEVLQFKWKFKIIDGMEVSKNFSHFFQLKAVGDDDSQPIITITGREKSGSDVIEIRHAASGTSGTDYLDESSWSDAQDLWLQAECIAELTDSGYFFLSVTTLDGSETILWAEESSIDLWRSDSTDDNTQIVRPKWGIYRSLKDKDNLRSDEEQVRFADFEISKGFLTEK